MTIGPVHGTGEKLIHNFIRQSWLKEITWQSCVCVCVCVCARDSKLKNVTLESPFVCLGIGCSDGLLWRRQWNLGFDRRIWFSVSWSTGTLLRMIPFRGLFNYLEHSYTGMRCITTFQSTTDRIYDGGPKRLYNYDMLKCNTIVLQLPTVFSTVTCCTGL